MVSAMAKAGLTTARQKKPSAKSARANCAMTLLFKVSEFRTK